MSNISLLLHEPVIISDSFTRANSAVTLGNTETGQAWTTGSGTWGISTGRAYCVTAVTGDTRFIETNTPDYTAECILNGILMTGNVSFPSLVIHGLDVNNYIYARLYNGNLELYKKDGGVVTSLASVATTTSDNTDYLVKVSCLGNVIKISVNNALLITYTLAGGDTKFAAYTKVGVRMNKAGTPASNAARWDNFKVEVT